MRKEWLFPTTQEKPEIKIAYGSKVVKSSKEIEDSKYFDLKGKNERITVGLTKQACKSR